jgi:ribosome maturation factor RimP
MISAERIREYLQEELTQRELFLVDVVVRPGNRIIVYVDSMKGVTLDECMSVSRFLESRFDRNAEDYELEVSSPGLDQPLKLPVQYEKNAGRQIEVVKNDGIKITGKLMQLHEGYILLETEVVVKDGKKGRKKKENILQEIKLEAIKSVKVVISLKK